jgi:hypothetical protein
MNTIINYKLTQDSILRAQLSQLELQGYQPLDCSQRFTRSVTFQRGDKTVTLRLVQLAPAVEPVTDAERMEKLEDNYRHFGDC